MLPPPNIFICTNKSELEISPLRVYVEGYSMDCSVIPTCRVGESASVNRNYALSLSKTPVIIMIDDDVAGFYRGWWRDLISVLEDPNVVFASARLMTEDGSLAGMMYGSTNLEMPTEDVPQAPTACCAFRIDNAMKFDEGFKGSGMEDSLFCWQLRKRYTSGRILINNNCRIIHYNVMQGQLENYEHNKKIYEEKTGVRIPTSLDDLDEMVVT